MPRRSLRSGLTAALFAMMAMLGGVEHAYAQACEAWRAELSRLMGMSGGGDPGAAREAQRVGAELSRTIGQYQAMGCERQQFLFFGDAPPPQCGPMRQRLGQLQASYGALQRQAQGAGPAIAQRRAQLQAALDANCRPGVYQTEPPRGRGLFEALFGLPERERLPSGMPELDPPLEDKPRDAMWGSGKAVCVRTCDGFFFPVPTSTGSRESTEDFCQALCPASETRLFYLGGSGEIENAVGRGGQRYADLPNALRYTKAFDGACGCRKPGETWAQALAEAEEMLARRKGDLIVTAQKAEELSRPRETRRADGKGTDPKAADSRGRRNQPAATAEAPSIPARPGGAPAAPATDSEPDAATIETPTSGTASAGIGPKAIEDDKPVSAAQGQTREVVGSDGARKTVRIVAPGVTPTTGSNRPAGPVTLRQ